MAQTERAKCYYITIPGMIQGKISAEHGKIAQNQPIRGMISADFRLTAARQSVFAKFRFLYYIGLDVMRAGRIATSSHQQRKIATVLPFRPPSGHTRHGAHARNRAQPLPRLHHQRTRATARPILSFRCFCLAKRRAIWYDEISRNRVLTP